MIENKLKIFLKKKNNKRININPDLITIEILDSYSIIELCDYIESDLKLKCPVNKISTANFNSIYLIVKFLKKYNKSI